MKIAIKFGDNDFYNCFFGVLKTLLSAYQHCGKLPTDKKQLCVVINEISYGHYLLFQNQFEYNEEVNGKVCTRTKDWVQITPKQILLGDEIDAYIKKVEWGNSETFILDTDLESITSF